MSPELSIIRCEGRKLYFFFSGEAAHEAYRLVIEGDCSIFDQMPFNLEVSTRSCCRR